MVLAFSCIYLLFCKSARTLYSHDVGTVKVVSLFILYLAYCIPLSVHCNSNCKIRKTTVFAIKELFVCFRNGINSWSEKILTKDTTSFTKMDQDNYNPYCVSQTPGSNEGRDFCWFFFFFHFCILRNQNNAWHIIIAQ